MPPCKAGFRSCVTPRTIREYSPFLIDRDSRREILVVFNNAGEARGEYRHFFFSENWHACSRLRAKVFSLVLEGTTSSPWNCRLFPAWSYEIWTRSGRRPSARDIETGKRTGTANLTAAGR
jgi:hypothetical protein